jgi:flavorubredoxin
MGKIISDTSERLSNTVDKEVGSIVGQHIEEDVEEILKALEEKSHVFLGEDDDQANS